MPAAYIPVSSFPLSECIAAGSSWQASCLELGAALRAALVATLFPQPPTATRFHLIQKGTAPQTIEIIPCRVSR